MASKIITKPQRHQKLGELLKEKQEPFVLDLYLFERGYLKKSLSSKIECNTFKCCNIINGNLNNKSHTKGFSSYSRILRGIVKKLCDRKRKTKFSVEEVSDGNRFSSESCITEEEVVANNNQLSPVSVLEQNPQLTKIRSREERERSESEADCSIKLPNDSISVKPIKTRTRVIFIDDDDSMKLVGSDKFAKSKRALQQTRQLLFDCVKEIVESHAINNYSGEKAKKLCNKGLFVPEELGSLILERVKAWDSHVGSESNALNSSIDSDIADQEWKICFESEKREMCSEIGDFIVESIIYEIVDEILQKY